MGEQVVRRGDHVLSAAATKKYTTKDSGERIVRDSGFQRDVETGKPRFDLLINHTLPYEQQFLTRIAVRLAQGAEKYSDSEEPFMCNWQRAEELTDLQRFMSSASRHLMQWMSGDRTEDHAAAVFFNVRGYEEIRQRMINEGKIREDETP